MGIAAAVAMLIAGGCASRVDRRVGAPAGGGVDWGVVFPAGASLVEPEGDEVSRRNLALNERREMPITAADEWPAPLRPSMEREVRVRIPSNERSFLFFGFERPAASSYCR